MSDVTPEADVAGRGGGSARKPRWSPVGAGRRLSERTPLRTKLITAVLALVILALAAISVASVYMLRNYVATQHDTDIDSLMYHVNSSQRLPGNVSLGYASPSFQTDVVVGLQVPGSQLAWGKYNLPTLGAQAPLPRLPTNGLWTGKGAVTSGIRSVPAQSGPNTWRVLAEPVTVTNQATGAQTTAILVVAVDLGNLNALTTRLVLFDLIVGGAIVVVLAAVGVAVVQTNLRPLNDIEMTAGQIALGHLDHRVPEGDPRTEVGSLGRSLNAMLTQIESAFHAQEASQRAAHQSEERMRRFTTDAAHELRTPLTTIRGFAAHYRQRGGANGWRSRVPAGRAAEAEVSGAAVAGAEAVGAGQDPSSRTGAGTPGDARYSPGSGPAAGGLSPEELDHLMGRVEAEATRMGLLVEDLLTLARIDQQRPLAKAPVDLLTVAVDAVQDARIVAPGRPIDLVVAPGTAFIVEGDEPRLRQVLGNLVNNALTHTPAGTPVRVKIGGGTLEADAAAGTARRAEPDEHNGWAGQGEEGSQATPDGRRLPAVVLDVADDGPGMSADQAQRVFERFYRADAARNRASGGTGLGLAIVAGLVAAHGGTVSVRTGPGQGADFQVKLPLSPDALPAEEPDDDLPG